jgi:hypothetical protein
MAWKKIIVSGSAAELASATLTGALVADTISGTVNADNGVVSGSSQIDLTLTDGYAAYSSSVSASIAAKPSDWDSLLNKPSGIVSSSAQTVANLVGEDIVADSFTGDGSGLSNVTIAQTATVVETFSNVTTYTVTHNFGSKNILVTVYDSSDFQIIPATVQAASDNTATFTFDNPTSGKVIVGQGGHIVSGSVPFDNIINKPTLVSGSGQIEIQSTEGFTGLQSNISGSIDALSGSTATAVSNLSASAHTARASLASSLVISGSTGNDIVNLKTDALSFVGTANEISTTVTNNQIEIGIVDNPTLTGNVTITGNLNVTGDTIQAQVTNINVEDRFILLNSGSTTGDAGIIFGGSDGTSNEGSGIFWDSPANVFGFASGIGAEDTSATHTSKLGNIQVAASSPAGAPSFQGVGTIAVNSSDEGIWIYS